MAPLYAAKLPDHGGDARRRSSMEYRWRRSRQSGKLAYEAHRREGEGIIAMIAPHPRPKSSVFVVKLKARTKDDGSIRSLRWLLKRLLRGHRLICVSVTEERAA